MTNDIWRDDICSCDFRGKTSFEGYGLDYGLMSWYTIDNRLLVSIKDLRQIHLLREHYLISSCLLDAVIDDTEPRDALPPFTSGRQSGLTEARPRTVSVSEVTCKPAIEFIQEAITPMSNRK